MWTENRLELGTSPPGSVENMGLFIALSAQTVHHPLGALGSERLFRKAQLHPQAWRHAECDRAIRAWGGFICWCLSPISAVLELSSSGTAVYTGFRLGTKIVVSSSSVEHSHLFCFFFIWIFMLLTNIIDFEGCVFWGVQPHESVVDVHKLYYLNLCICGWMHIVNWSFLCPAVGSCWLYTSNLLVYIC